MWIYNVVDYRDKRSMPTRQASAALTKSSDNSIKIKQPWSQTLFRSTLVLNSAGHDFEIIIWEE
jgi:hypothetical protein